MTAQRASNSLAFSLAQHRKIKFDLINNKQGKEKKSLMNMGSDGHIRPGSICPMYLVRTRPGLPE